MKKKTSKRSPSQSTGHVVKTQSKRDVVLTGVALSCLTFVAFSRILFNGFVDYDDDQYITENSQIQAGLTIQSLYYVVTDTSTGNWHPVTMLSHTLDCALFSLERWGII